MPHALPDVIRARAGADFGRVAADKGVPGLVLEIPDAFAEEASRNKVKEACRDSEEDLEFCRVATAGKMVSALQAQMPG